MDPETVSRTYSRIGGHRALDLVNTVEWRLDPARSIEDLPDFGGVLAWAEQTNLVQEEEADGLRRIAAEQREEAAAQHRRILRLRETAYAALAGQSTSAADALARDYRAVLNRAVLQRSVKPEAVTHERTLRDGEAITWRWTDRSIGLHTPGDRIIHDVLELLTSPDLALLHQCEDVACGWLYLDTSRRHNRRWCAADDCGNRNRARRYYARHKSRTLETTD